MLEDLIILVLLIFAKGFITAVSTAIRVLEMRKARYVSDEEDDRNLRLKKIIKSAKYHANVAAFIKSLILIIMGYIVLGDLSDEIMAFVNSDSVIIRYIIIIAIICVSSYITTVLGSVVPKLIANRYPDAVAMKCDWLLSILYYVFLPFAWLIHIASTLVRGILGNEYNENDDVSEQEILMMIDASEETGNIDEDEKEMINNIFDFDDITAGEVSTHRKDIVSLSIDASIDDIISLITEEKYTRIPVYKDNIDNVVGILHIKDFMKYIIVNGRSNFDIKNILMEPFFIPFTKKADDLFKEMQSNKIHLAIVVDEYGGTAGIVTMEDLIEEVMGNILDEYDEEEVPDIAELENDTWVIEGTTSLDDVAQELEADLPLDEYETLSGFIIGQLGHIPEDNENIVLTYNGFEFRVEKIEDKRIVNVKVIKFETPDSLTEEE